MNQANLEFRKNNSETLSRPVKQDSFRCLKDIQSIVDNMINPDDNIMSINNNNFNDYSFNNQSFYQS